MTAQADAPSENGPARTPATQREIRMVFAGLLVAMLLAALDQNIVSTALPRIVSDLGGLAHLSWVVTAFMLASTATTPLYGKLSDMYGRKPLFYVAIGLFLLGSVLCGLSQTMMQLIIFRAIQGLGAGGLMTLSQTTIGDILEPRERGKYQGLFMGVWAVGSVIGPLAGGLLTSGLSWRWIFYINIPVGALAVFLISVGLKGTNRLVRHNLDYAGAVLMMAMTSVLLLVLSWGGALYPWLSPQILGLTALVVVLGGLLMLRETMAAEPILALDLFKNRVFSIGAAVTGISSLGMFGVMVFMSLYFQLVAGAGPAQAGFLLMPQIGGLIVASVISGNLVSRTGRYKTALLAGSGVTALGLFLMTWAAAVPTSGLWVIEACLIFVGFGMGSMMPNLTVAVQNSVERYKLGAATSSLAYMRSLGGSIGVALFGGLMTAQLQRALARHTKLDVHALLDHGIQQIAGLPAVEKALVVESYREAIATVFLTGALVSTLGFGLVMLMPDKELRGGEPEAPPVEV